MMDKAFKVAVLALLIWNAWEIRWVDGTADQARYHAIAAEEAAGYAQQAAEHCAK